MSGDWEWSIWRAFIKSLFIWLPYEYDSWLRPWPHMRLPSSIENIQQKKECFSSQTLYHCQMETIKIKRFSVACFQNCILWFIESNLYHEILQYHVQDHHVVDLFCLLLVVVLHRWKFAFSDFLLRKTWFWMAVGVWIEWICANMQSVTEIEVKWSKKMRSNPCFQIPSVFK